MTVNPLTLCQGICHFLLFTDPQFTAFHKYYIQIKTVMKPYRNIFIRSDEEMAKSQMTGTLEIPYTGEIFYNIVTEDGTDPEGYDPEVDVYYRCNCEFKEFKSFKKV